MGPDLLSQSSFTMLSEWPFRLHNLRAHETSLSLKTSPVLLSSDLSTHGSYGPGRSLHCEL